MVVVVLVVRRINFFFYTFFIRPTDQDQDDWRRTKEDLWTERLLSSIRVEERSRAVNDPDTNNAKWPISQEYLLRRRSDTHNKHTRLEGKEVVAKSGLG